jgi:hypothetical protein
MRTVGLLFTAGYGPQNPITGVVVETDAFGVHLTSLISIVGTVNDSPPARDGA